MAEKTFEWTWDSDTSLWVSAPFTPGSCGTMYWKVDTKEQAIAWTKRHMGVVKAVFVEARIAK